MNLLRLLLLAALLWALYRLVRSLFPVRGREQRGAPETRLVGGELVQDPHCGVYIPKDTACRGKNGTHFCSEECRRAFEAKDG